MLNLKDILARYKVTKPTIYRWMDEGIFPLPITIGKTVRWNEKTLDEWESQGCPKLPKPNKDSHGYRKQTHYLTKEELDEDAERYVREAIRKYKNLYGNNPKGVQEKLKAAEKLISDEFLTYYEYALRIFYSSPDGQYLSWAFERWAGVRVCKSLKEAGLWPWKDEG